MAGEESLPSNSFSKTQIAVEDGNSRDGLSSDLSISNFPPLTSKSGNRNQILGFKEKWSSLVSIKAPSDDCSLERQDAVLMEGNKGVGLSSVNFEDQTKDCKKLVIGFFADKKLPFYTVKEAINNIWKPKSEVTISIHSNRVFVFNFDNEEDRKVALEHGSFYMGTKLFIVRPWTLLIEKSIADLKTIPVWVLIYNVPLHLWNKLGLSSIATFLGNPLMMDEHTRKKTRLSYARICVEINFDCSFPNQIPLWIDGVHIMDLPVEYPWKPSKCSKCSSFGHTTSSCTIPRGKKKAHWTPKKKQPIAKEVERISVENIVESTPLFTVNNEVNVEVENGDKPQGEVVGASEMETTTLEHSSANDGQLQIAEKMTENSAPPAHHHEFLWTYAKRNKKSGKKTELTKPVPTSHLNPFDILFQDGELEQGLVRRSGATIEDESNVSTDVASTDGNNLDCHDDQLIGVTIDTGGDNVGHRIGELNESCNGQEVTPINSLPVIIGKPIHENVLEGTVVSCDEACEDEDASEVSEYETDVEEMPIKKIKPLVEIRRKSPTKEQHMAKLLDGFSALVKPPTCSREMEIKKIFGDITDRYKGTKADKDLGPCDEKLGRGKRTPAKKNI